ncbi:MAG: hypothetical protein ACRD2B_18945 [Terriglobia bacterium]
MKLILVSSLLAVLTAFPAASAPLPVSIINVKLKPETVAGFEHYVKATELRIDRQISRPDTFLYLDDIPGRERILTSLQHGGLFIERLETRDASGRVLTTPDGLIHHWIGDVFIPGVSLRDVLGAVEDYNDAAKFYAPEVVRSRLLSRKGNDFKVAMRFSEVKLITVTFDTVQDVRYTELDPDHWSSRSVSRRIAEVVDAGKPDEHDRPPGDDAGFLWRINSYWRFVQQDGGVYVECESISLTRGIPTGLGWLVGPFVTTIPQELLRNTLADTRKAVLAAGSVRKP